MYLYGILNYKVSKGKTQDLLQFDETEQSNIPIFNGYESS
jgi:hypothetical protein